MRALIAAILLVFFTLGSTGCIGRMALAGRVGKFNLEVAEGKWAREAVFLGLYIIPVYPIAGALDLIIFNSIEFHTGTNPLSGQDRLARVGDQHYVAAPDGSAGISTLREDGSIDVEIRGADGSVHFINFVREDGEMVARDAHGERIARFDATTGRVEPIAPEARAL